jgi:protein-tyrosine kinase
LSKIQDALRKFQKGAESSPSDGDSGSSARRHRIPETVIPIVRSKVKLQDSQRHHLEEEDLIRGGLLAPLDHALPISDEFRRIKRPLLDNARKSVGKTEDHMNVIMVASALPGAGKTFCALNLAASISLERELNVLLIDADVAKPHISSALGMSEFPGLIDVLEDETSSVEDFLIRTDLNDIQVLPAGRRHSQATELLASVRMAELIDELSRRYPDRIIVMDSPPLLITSEARALAQQVGQIALVVESGKTGHQDLKETLENLDQSKPINVILNKSVYTQPGGYYGGGYGYYGFNEED